MTVTVLMLHDYRLLGGSTNPTKFNFLIKNYDTLHIAEMEHFYFDDFDEERDGLFPKRFVDQVIRRNKQNVEYNPIDDQTILDFQNLLKSKQHVVDRLEYVVNKWRRRYLSSQYEFQEQLDREKYAEAKEIVKEQHNPGSFDVAGSLVGRLATLANTDVYRFANQLVVEYGEKQMMLIETEYLRTRFEAALMNANTEAEVSKVRQDLVAVTNYFV